MKKILQFSFLVSVLISCSLATSCTSVNNGDNDNEKPEQGVPEEYFTGGKLGTTEVWGSKCFEQPTPAVENAGLANSFLHGEAIFEGNFVTEATDPTYPMRGRGPISIRSSCIHCHPGYGHGKRLGNLGQDVFGFNTKTRETGNGYLLVIYGPGKDGVFGGNDVITSGITGSTWTDAANDDWFVSEMTGMPQTQSNEPFKAPIDEDKIQIKWHLYVDEHGNKFADGTSYELIYPEVIIPEDAFAYESENLKTGKYDVRVEATIGIYGSGLIDAIKEEDIDATYNAQMGKPWGGRRGTDKKQPDGSVRKGRFTYAVSRGTLQYGAGSNAIWNITNVTKESSNSEHQSNYMTPFYANNAAKDPEVKAKLANTYYKFLIGATEEETENKIYNYLMFNSTYGGKKYTSRNEVDKSTQIKPELSLDDYTELMVWHRGLAVPAARNVNTPEFKRGKELFTQMGCASCHQPSWTTGSDNYVGDQDMLGKLPTYPNQKIWPYTDLLQHNLGMKNNIRGGWCRTTPLWGRYLNLVANGESSHLHDMRARNYEEAIMWHKGQGQYSSNKFRELPKEDRDAVVKFLQSI